MRYEGLALSGPVISHNNWAEAMNDANKMAKVNMMCRMSDVYSQKTISTKVGIIC